VSVQIADLPINKRINQSASGKHFSASQKHISEALTPAFIGVLLWSNSNAPMHAVHAMQCINSY
jgi:hypothetical protein